MKTKVIRVNVTQNGIGIVGFAWAASEISYFVKTINGVVEVMKDQINAFFESKLVTNKKVQSWAI